MLPTYKGISYIAVDIDNATPPLGTLTDNLWTIITILEDNINTEKPRSCSICERMTTGVMCKPQLFSVLANTTPQLKLAVSPVMADSNF